jgi:hypothetical protein
MTSPSQQPPDFLRPMDTQSDLAPAESKALLKRLLAGTSHWVRFDEKGRAAFFGPQPIEGAVLVEGVTGDFLIRHVLIDGQWLPRPPDPEIEPTPEEIARQQEEAYQAALAAREAEIDAAILASPAYRQFLRGEMTLTAYREAATEIADRFPKPGA